MFIDIPPATLPVAQQVVAGPSTSTRTFNNIEGVCNPIYSYDVFGGPDEGNFAPGNDIGGAYQPALIEALGYYWDNKRQGYFNAQRQQYPYKQERTQVLVKPRLGEIEGKTYFPYIGDSGKDKIVLLVTSLGKHFKVSITLNVKNDTPNSTPLEPCRIIKAPAPGAAASWFNPDHSNFTVNFSDIPGQSLGTTVGTTTVTKK